MKRCSLWVTGQGARYANGALKSLVLLIVESTPAEHTLNYPALISCCLNTIHNILFALVIM